MLYVLAAIAILQGILSLLDGFRAARHIRTFRPSHKSNDKVIVFCPCKGVDAEFEGNIRSILDQDYTNFEVKFLVEAEHDPAYTALRQMGVAEVLVAGQSTDRGQKVHNLAYGVEHTAGSQVIYVFCDSDARFPRQWLSKLTAPLNEQNVTTGYRWYVADRLHLPTLLRSAWNASVVTMLGDHERNFVWGGSMALARSTFERLQILDAWKGSLSDDYSITRAAERAGAKIVFVPECLIPSYGRCTWHELLEFTTRQVTITRVYHPRLWRLAFFSQLVFNGAFWGLLFTKPALALLLYLLSAAKGALRLDAVRSVLPPAALSKRGWFYILFSPLVALLYLYNLICSALRTEITWGHIRYKLVSANETHRKV
jgi:ceramide glucosyltransferase